MGKCLSEMTLKELWELFPIVLVEHQDCWSGWYQEEKSRIDTFLEIKDRKLHHIGSTAIDGLWAKPIIDILLEIPASVSMDKTRQTLINNGYRCMSDQADRMSFNRGYTEKGFAKQVFHLHLRYRGDHDELYFRDYMNEHAGIAKEYEALKLSLWKRYEHDRDAYTNAKTAFIKQYTERAKRDYGNRYELS